jgi:hypothetical protein
MDQTQHRPWHLWIVAPLAVVWMALSACDYLLVTLGAQDYLRQFSADQAAFFTGLEVQAKALWATYVWAGVAGALGLLMSEAWAPLAFAVDKLVGADQRSFADFSRRHPQRTDPDCQPRRCLNAVALRARFAGERRAGLTAHPCAIWIKQGRLDPLCTAPLT